MIERYWLPPGTVVKAGGIPLRLETETIVQTEKENWLLAKEHMEFPPESPLPGSEGTKGG